MRKRQKISVSRNTLIPEGVEDVVYDRVPAETEEDEELISFDASDEGIDADSEGDGDDSNSPPPVPSEFTIISQTYRYGIDGSVTVDVIFETDVDGYELDPRITPL